MKDREPPFEGGSQPVRERPPEVATRGQGVLHDLVIGVAVAVLLGAAIWLVLPFLY